MTKAATFLSVIQAYHRSSVGPLVTGPTDANDGLFTRFLDASAASGFSQPVATPGSPTGSKAIGKLNGGGGMPAPVIMLEPGPSNAGDNGPTAVRMLDPGPSY